jgi:hypothetical protein
MSTRERKVKENVKVDTIQAIEQAQSEKKLRQVYTLKEVIETPNTYLIAKHKIWRVIITLTNFNGERLKIRITQPINGRFIQILNINYDRLQDVINILTILRQKLHEQGADQKFIKPQSEELF